MTRNNLKYKIRQGFSEITPDILDDIMEQIEIEGALSEGYVYARNAARPEKRRISFMRVQRIAAACVMCVLIGIGVFQMSGIGAPTYGGEEYVVFMQINPSVRMVFNEEYELLEFRGLNADGKALEERLNIEETITLPEVIEKVVEDGQKEGYLNKKNDIHFTFVKKEREEYAQWKDGFANTVEETLVEKKDVEIATVYEESEKGETLEKKLDEELNKDLDKELEKELNKEQSEIEEKSAESKEKTAGDAVKDEDKQNQNVLETEEKSTEVQNQNTLETEENSTEMQDQSILETEETNTDMQDQSTLETEETNTDVQDQSTLETEENNIEMQDQSTLQTEEKSTDMQDQSTLQTEEKIDEKLNQKTPENDEKKNEKAIEKEEKKNSEANGS